MRPNQKICLLWSRFGPYHHARFKAVAKIGPVIGIEFSNYDPTYAWKSVAPPKGAKLVTLFSDVDSRTVSPAVIASKISNLMAQEKPDVVVIPGWSDKVALTVLAWCLANHVPSVVMSPSQAKDAPRNFVREWLKSRIVRLFSAGFCGGEPQKRYLESLGIPNSRIVSGYNVIDNAHFYAGAQKARKFASRTRKQLRLPLKYFVVSARFVPKKNLERLLQAYKQYLEKHPAKAWSLVIMGDGPQRPLLNDIILKENLSSYVFLPGFKQYDELPAYYGLASALLLPSVSEQWGLAVNEGMACGLPVLVSSHCGCSEDLVREGKNGFVFDPLNLDSIANTLRKISSPETNLKSMGNESLKIINQWNPNAFAKNLWKSVGIAQNTVIQSPSHLDRLMLRLLRYRVESEYQEK